MRSPQIDQAFLTVEASSRGNHTNLALIRTAYEVLVITGGGKWVEIKTHTDPLYQHLIVTAERKFWRCVECGDALDRRKPQGKKASFPIRAAGIISSRK